MLKGAALLPFRIDTEGSLQAAVAGALQRWQQGRLGLTDPAAGLAYDPSASAHLDLLLQWVARLRAGSGPVAHHNPR